MSNFTLQDPSFYMSILANKEKYQCTCLYIHADPKNQSDMKWNIGAYMHNHKHITYSKTEIPETQQRDIFTSEADSIVNTEIRYLKCPCSR